MNNSHTYSPHMIWIIAGLLLAAVGQLTVWCLNNPSLQGIGGVIAVISRTVFTAMIPATTTRDY